MIGIKRILLGTVMAAALTTPAMAGTGWYLGLDGGWVSPQDVTVTGPGAGGGSGGQFQLKDSFRITGLVGYKWDNGLRIQAQADYYDGKQKSFDPPPAGPPIFPCLANCSAPIWSIGAGLGYDIPFGSHWGLSVGGGGGVAFLHSSGPVIVGSPAVFAWQLQAGPYFSLSDNLDLDIFYAYSSVSSSHFHNGTFGPPNAINFGEAASHNIMIGFRYYLYHEPPPAPPYVPPPPPPPPMAPPPVKTFIVFFDFDKSNLTAEAQSVVTEAVAAAKSNGWVKVMVTGHTDTVGSDTYNQALSERRAEAVKDEMVRQGMSAGDITTQGKSFHDPLVPTGPGVREPQNRRAVIEY
jgi:opacity protein-like surface antigen